MQRLAASVSQIHLHLLIVGLTVFGGPDRTLYSPERLAKLGDEAGKSDTVFSLNDRMGLVQDAIILARSGHGKTSSALSFISKLGNEKENLVWTEIGSALASIDDAWSQQPQQVRDAINALRRKLFKPLVDRLGFEYKAGEDVDTIELRTLAIATAAAAGDESVLAEYKKRFDALLSNNDHSSIPGDLRGSIFSQMVKRGGAKEYEKVLEIFKKPPSPAHQIAAMRGLSSATDAELIKKTTDLTFSKDVRNQVRFRDQRGVMPF